MVHHSVCYNEIKGDGKHALSCCWILDGLFDGIIEFLPCLHDHDMDFLTVDPAGDLVHRTEFTEATVATHQIGGSRRWGQGFHDAKLASFREGINLRFGYPLTPW